MTGLRLRAGQGDQPGFLPAVEDTRDRRFRAWFTSKRRVEPLLDQALSDSVDAGETAIEGFHDAAIAPALAAVRDVGLEQDAHLEDHGGRIFAFTDQRLQPRALVWVQPHHVHLQNDL